MKYIYDCLKYWCECNCLIDGVKINDGKIVVDSEYNVYSINSIRFSNMVEIEIQSKNDKIYESRRIFKQANNIYRFLVNNEIHSLLKLFNFQNVKDSSNCIIVTVSDNMDIVFSGNRIRFFKNDKVVKVTNLTKVNLSHLKWLIAEFNIPQWVYSYWNFDYKRMCLLTYGFKEYRRRLYHDSNGYWCRLNGSVLRLKDEQVL